MIGLVWVGFMHPTKNPIIDNIFELMYGLWAKYRLKITFRSSLEKLFTERGCDL